MLVDKFNFLLQLLLKITAYFSRFYCNKLALVVSFQKFSDRYGFETEKVRGGRGLGWSAGRVLVTKSASASAGREWTKISTRAGLLYLYQNL